MLKYNQYSENTVSVNCSNYWGVTSVRILRGVKNTDFDGEKCGGKILSLLGNRLKCKL